MNAGLGRDDILAFWVGEPDEATPDFIRKAGTDAIAAGDVFQTTGYPAFDRRLGGSINGVIAALNRIIRLAVPTHNAEGGTMIVPGHGYLADEHELVEYRDMVVIVRDRVQSMIAAGASC